MKSEEEEEKKFPFTATFSEYVFPGVVAVQYCSMCLPVLASHYTRLL